MKRKKKPVEIDYDPYEHLDRSGPTMVMGLFVLYMIILFALFYRGQ